MLIKRPEKLNDSAENDQSAEVYIDVQNKLIHLNAGVGNLTAADGVTGKALYSFFKQQWRVDPLGKGLLKFHFPIVAITNDYCELIDLVLVDGWNYADDEYQQLICYSGKDA